MHSHQKYIHYYNLYLLHSNILDFAWMSESPYTCRYTFVAKWIHCCYVPFSFFAHVLTDMFKQKHIYIHTIFVSVTPTHTQISNKQYSNIFPTLYFYLVVSTWNCLLHVIMLWIFFCLRCSFLCVVNCGRTLKVLFLTKPWKN